MVIYWAVGRGVWSSASAQVLPVWSRKKEPMGFVDCFLRVTRLLWALEFFRLIFI